MQKGWNRSVSRPRPRAFRRPRVLLVGCGDVGRRIAAQLPAHWVAIGTARRPETAAELRAQGIRVARVDLDDFASAKRLRGLARRLVMLAPPPNVGTDDPRTRRLLAVLGMLARGSGPTARVVPRLAYVGTTGVYGNRDGDWVDETTPIRPESARARRRAAAESRLKRATAAGTVAAVRLRAPGIYAAERLPLERLRAGLPVAEGERDAFSNHIHADDLAALAMAALLRGRTGRAYDTVDGGAMRIGEWLDRVADHAGLARPPRMAWDELAARVSPMMLSFLRESRRIRGRRVAELGVRLRWPDAAAFLAAHPRG